MNAAHMGFAFLAYFFLVILFKFLVQLLTSYQPIPSRDRSAGHSDAWLITLSPDIFWATHFKNRFRSGDVGPDQLKAHDAKKNQLARFVQASNLGNFWLSLVILFVAFGYVSDEPLSGFLEHCVAAFVVLRMISRSVEIAYAFGRDVFETDKPGEYKSSTGLDAQERILLALVSYAEIFIYSAAAYIFIFPDPHLWHSVYLSLCIGTLTNVAIAFPNPNTFEPYPLICFVQVFTTMSLIILSIASYLSRKPGG